MSNATILTAALKVGGLIASLLATGLMLSAFALHAEGNAIFKGAAFVQWLVGALVFTACMFFVLKENVYFIGLLLAFIFAISVGIGTFGSPVITVHCVSENRR